MLYGEIKETVILRKETDKTVGKKKTKFGMWLTSHVTGAWQGVTAREHQVSAYKAYFDTYRCTPFFSPLNCALQL
ncbi:hypothetical protein VNO77_21560 [Canavalia gladiata]|uniref:Uncharacterized protein n=1 Tax=Canavalia gladiata TaxID=3824 RepID=A0AAN9LRN8_CANGL